MKNEKVLCEYCRKFVDYIILEKNLSGELCGEIYHYDGKEARCAECNCEIYVGEVNDYNLNELYKKFRKIKKREICMEKSVDKAPAAINTDAMDTNQLRIEVLVGYQDMPDGNVHDAKNAIDRFRSEVQYLEQKMIDYKAGNLKIEEHDLIEE